MSSTRITYTPRHEATSAGERHALAAVYRIVVDHAKKSAAGVTSTNGDDAVKGSRDDRAEDIIPQK